MGSIVGLGEFFSSIKPKTMFIRKFIFTILCSIVVSSILAQSSHENPQYDIVFPQRKVNKLVITLKKEDWQHIQSEMKNILKTEFGTMKNGRGMPNMPPPNFDRNTPNRQDRQWGSPMKMIQKDPPYVSAKLTFKDSTWQQVGFRLKGNSSLMMSWGQGIYKLPFRLNFGKYIKKGSDFYGFEELSMSPAMGDNSLMREKVMNEIFQKAGINAPQTAYYQVYIDFGEGEKYCGIYTMVEVVDDTMIKTQFGEKSGNIYKPESTFARFDSTAFERKNKKSSPADWSDIKQLIKVLNATSRTNNPAQWRSDLEGVFNVNQFLKWLAVNAVAVNWDTYGAMAHNFYLYNSPLGHLTWIPWDNNEALKTGRGGDGFAGPPDMNGMPAFNPTMQQGDAPAMPTGGREMPPQMMPPMMGKSGSLSQKEVTDRWPLIRFLMDDEVYAKRYKNYVKAFSVYIFTPAKMHALLDEHYQLLKPLVALEQKPYSQLTDVNAFEKEFEGLKKHIEARQEAVQTFLME